MILILYIISYLLLCACASEEGSIQLWFLLLYTLVRGPLGSSEYGGREDLLYHVYVCRNASPFCARYRSIFRLFFCPFGWPIYFVIQTQCCYFIRHVIRQTRQWNETRCETNDLVVSEAMTIIIVPCDSIWRICTIL